MDQIKNCHSYENCPTLCSCPPAYRDTSPQGLVYLNTYETDQRKCKPSHENLNGLERINEMGNVYIYIVVPCCFSQLINF